eukprot:COSAG02_NODE_1047_length_14982_cov_4.007929_10_plen_109_part_00
MERRLAEDEMPAVNKGALKKQQGRGHTLRDVTAAEMRASGGVSGEAAACPKHCKDAYITTNHTILVTAARSPQDRFPATGRFNSIWLIVLGDVDDVHLRALPAPCAPS